MTSKEYLINNHILFKYFEFVKILWIGISSARTGKNFVKIDRHLSELWKKEKAVLLMKHGVEFVFYTEFWVL